MFFINKNALYVIPVSWFNKSKIVGGGNVCLLITSNTLLLPLKLLNKNALFTTIWLWLTIISELLLEVVTRYRNCQTWYRTEQRVKKKNFEALDWTQKRTRKCAHLRQLIPCSKSYSMWPSMLFRCHNECCPNPHPRYNHQHLRLI